MVMDVNMHRLCVNMIRGNEISLFKVGQGCNK